jgi:hypothetical protein
METYLIINAQGNIVAWCCTESDAEALSWIPPNYSLQPMPPRFDRSKYHHATAKTYRSSPLNTAKRQKPIANIRRVITVRVSQDTSNWLDSLSVTASVVANLLEKAAKQ